MTHWDSQAKIILQVDAYMWFEGKGWGERDKQIVFTTQCDMYWGMTWRACLLDIEKPYQKGARELSTGGGAWDKAQSPYRQGVHHWHTGYQAELVDTDNDGFVFLMMRLPRNSCLLSLGDGALFCKSWDFSESFQQKVLRSRKERHRNLMNARSMLPARKS